MRKLIYNVGISADGFIAGPNGEFDWLYTDQEYGLSEFLDGIEYTVMGRKSFDVVYLHDKNFFRDRTHYIFTSSAHPQMPANVSFISGDPSEFTKALKAGPGKSIWLVGGGALAGTLLKAGLIDELLLSYHPVVLGKGIHAFGLTEANSYFETTDVRNYETGLVQIRMKKTSVN